MRNHVKLFEAWLNEMPKEFIDKLKSGDVNFKAPF